MSRPRASRARIAASVVAPAPPTAGTHEITGPPGEVLSPDSASRSTTHRPASGSSATCSAPSATAPCQVDAGVGSSLRPLPRRTTMTESRRGRAREAAAASTSSPTKTSGARVHVDAVGSSRTVISMPAAAASLTTSSRSRGSEVMSKGRGVSVMRGESLPPRRRAARDGWAGDNRAVRVLWMCAAG